MLCGQRVNQFAQCLAGHDLRQFVKREIDAVIRHPALRKIIGANALGAIAGTDLLAAVRRVRRIDALFEIETGKPRRTAWPFAED